MPSVRVRKAYSSIEDPDAPAISPSNPNSTTGRRGSTARRRTLRSIFSNAEPTPTPGSERADNLGVGVPSTSQAASPGTGSVPIHVVVTPDNLSPADNEEEADDEAYGYGTTRQQHRRMRTTPPRSMIADSVAAAANNRRRRASSAATRAFSLNPSLMGQDDLAARRGRGLSVSESATGSALGGPSRAPPPLHATFDTDHLAVPTRDGVPPPAMDTPDRQLRRRNSSLARGGEGTSIGLVIPSANLRGNIASAVTAASEPRTTSQATSHHDRDLEADPIPDDEDEDDHMSSDYTTDGSEIDEEEHHLDEVVDHLDVIDPEVAMISHLSNAANSIFIPRLPVYSRRPIVTLPTLTPSATMDSLIEKEEEGDEKGKKKRKGRFPKKHVKDQNELDAHVEHILKRRAKIRRMGRGLWQFVKTPIGFVFALYGFAVVFWGAAIVLFLLKWINLHNSNTQGFWVEISSQVVNALFTVTGVGLIPWRVMDTYRIMRIWHYKRLDRKLRRDKGLPPLEDEDELPDPLFDPGFTHVLTELQQKELRVQQKRFIKSQTWYRAHATDTHKAFPISTALLICLLTDANSVFQCLLCGCMWGLDRYTRPAWTTGCLIPASFLCGIGAAVFIARGGSKTKKTEEVEKRLRQALAEGRSNHNRAREQDVYARRAGLVGIIPMPADDEEDVDVVGNGAGAGNGNGKEGQSGIGRGHA